MAKAISYMRPDIDPNMRLYIPFNEGVGSIAKDYSQYGNHAQLTDVEWSPDGFNGAGKFNGSSSFGNCGNDASLSLGVNTDMTQEFGLKTSRIGQYNYFFAKYGSVGFETLTSITTGYIQFWVGDATGDLDITSIKSVVDGERHQVICVLKEPKGHIYIDGQESISGDVVGDIINFDNSNDLYIGKNPTPIWFDGTIDEFILRASIENAAQIAANCYEVVCS